MYADNPDSPFYKLVIASYKELAVRQKDGGSAGPAATPAVESVLRISIAEERRGSKSVFLFLRLPQIPPLSSGYSARFGGSWVPFGR